MDKVIRILGLLLMISHGVIAQQYVGDVWLKSQGEIDSFAMHYDGIKTIVGDVKIQEVVAGDIDNLMGLQILDSIMGSIEISQNVGLVSTIGVDDIEYIGGDWRINNNAFLEEVMMSTMLDTCWGGLSLQGNNMLVDISGLGHVKEIKGDLHLNQNEALSDLSGLEQLQYIGGDCIVEYSDVITSLTAFGSLEVVTGGVLVRECNALVDMEGLESLTSIGNSLSFIANESLESLEGLDELVSIGGSLFLHTNPSLGKLEGIPHLETVGGNFIVQYNDVLETLDGVENVLSMGEEIRIRDNNKLENISALNGIDISGLYALIIEGNDMLEVCNSDMVCSALTNEDIEVMIHQNGMNCYEEEQVVVQCSTPVHHILSAEKVVVYPNPAYDKIYVDVENGEINHIEIYTVLGELKLTVFESEIDISGLSAGMYAVKVATNTGTKVDKLVVK